MSSTPASATVGRSGSAATDADLLVERKPVLTLSLGMGGIPPRPDRRQRRQRDEFGSVPGIAPGVAGARYGSGGTAGLVKHTILEEWLESFASERDAWHSMALAAELHMARAEIFSAVFRARARVRA